MKMKLFVIFTFFMFSYGCIMVPPSGDKVVSGVEISDKQLIFIEEGVTLKSDILDQLGAPDIYLIDANIFAYNWRTRAAVILWAFGYGYGGVAGKKDIIDDHVLLIAFDKEDTVKKYKVKKWLRIESYGDQLIEWSQEDEK
jgi:outer membrane protein assembly factor BamE (lipoprotein component of BamABCDE complex)